VIVATDLRKFQTDRKVWKWKLNDASAVKRPQNWYLKLLKSSRKFRWYESHLEWIQSCECISLYILPILTTLPFNRLRASAKPIALRDPNLSLWFIRFIISINPFILYVGPKVASRCGWLNWTSAALIFSYRSYSSIVTVIFYIGPICINRKWTATVLYLSPR
jgi:hypothetical protein